ncbi:isoprenyl transferase [Actinoalloteichus spitiensis]|uniref:isoprenyl transferase n=1 Tax=Actinoalloteichus spitiensis TaxID=252394 RepID=UPI00069219A1
MPLRTASALGRKATLRTRIRDAIYSRYAKRLSGQLEGRPRPRHIGFVVDGNRRWAKSVGLSTVDGHRAGAEKIKTLLRWCDEQGIRHVTLYLLSTENLNRGPEELKPLMEIIEGVVNDLAADGNPWPVEIIGTLDMLPGDMARNLKTAAARTQGRRSGAQVNAAIGYGGRQEIVDAVRSLMLEHAATGRGMRELAEEVNPALISEHLYTQAQPDPEIIIRTSGEQRISGFLLWQSAEADLHFADCYWPALRYVDFLRALRSFADRRQVAGRFPSLGSIH